jgi:hypothetical protein
MTAAGIREPKGGAWRVVKVTERQQCIVYIPYMRSPCGESPVSITSGLDTNAS